MDKLPPPTHYQKGTKVIPAAKFPGNVPEDELDDWRPLYPAGTFCEPPEDTGGRPPLIVYGHLVTDRPKISELAAWYAEPRDWPPAPLKLDSGTAVLDVDKFVFWNLACLTSGGRRELLAPFYFRLLALKYIVENALWRT